MVPPMIRSLIVLVLAAAMSGPAVAQKRLADPRPMTGLDRSHLTTYTSVQEYLQTVPGGSLLDRATVVSRANISHRSVGALHPLQRQTSTAAKTLGALELMQISRAENGTANWITGRLPISTRAAIGASKNTAVAYQEQALAVVESVRREMKLENPRAELQPVRIETDDLGFTHTRFEQTYEGIPVWGRDLYVHFDAEGEVYAVNGTYEPTPRGVETRPAIASNAALDRVVAHLKSENRWAPLPEGVAHTFDLPGPSSRLVLYPDGGRSMRLAYEVTLHPNLIEWYTYIVDARDGSILNRIARHCSINHAEEAPVIDVGGFAAANGAGKSVTGTFVDAQGVDLNGQNRSFRAYQHDDGMYYSAWDLPNFDVGKSTMPDNLAGGGLTLTLNNSDLNEQATLYHVTSNNNTWSDASLVSAAVNMSIAYDYFKSVHARNAIDGNDQSIVSILHATMDGQAMDNAFWTGRFMVYGDGAQLMKPLAGGLDVAGHEMSHGVIEHSAGLVYQFQPGALNESFADVFGAMIDREDLLMGEDIMRTDIALRDLLNPDNPQLPNPQPAHMNQYMELNINQDNGGVHINSGIPNRAAALLIQAIGHDKTEDIYYRALTNYLTRNSQFGDARKAVIQAATDLFGAGSAEVTAAGQAFDQVGITDGTTGEGGGGGGTVPPKTGGQSLITFMDESGAIGYLNLTDPGNVTYAFFEDPNAVARANPEIGDMSQLTAGSSGERIWFIDWEGYLSFITVQTGEVSYFPDLNIQQAGDLWTASIAPDESYVALVSAYADDPTLYFFDGESLAAVDLKPEGTQEGVFIETIRYPDVVSWSPNPQDLRVAFDAYNELELGTGAAAFWGMYEINFSASKIYSLIPAQPSDVSIGNITYSKLSGDLIAFNYIDAQGIWDVMIGDFANGEIYSLDLPSYTYGGVQIRDAQRPTFAPNDELLAFTSPSLQAILFYEPTQQALNALELDWAIYNPYWFLLGGETSTDTDDQTELPTSVTLHGNYPNPFNPATTIRFELPSAADVQLDVYDVMGRRVRTLYEGPLSSGAHSFAFDAQGLASGTYLARLVAAGTVVTTKMVLAK